MVPIRKYIKIRQNGKAYYNLPAQCAAHVDCLRVSKELINLRNLPFNLSIAEKAHELATYVVSQSVHYTS